MVGTVRAKKTVYPIAETRYTFKEAICLCCREVIENKPLLKNLS